MADSTTNLDTISSTQGGKELTANELFDAASPASVYGRHASTCGGLTWGYYGGKVPISGVPTAVSNGTLTLAASSTNYVEANPATGAVSSNTSGFTSGYWRLYTAIAGASTVTSYTDHRFNGMFAGGGAAGVGDVVGPSSAVNNRVVLFDGTTGKLIKDSGLTLAGANTGDETATTLGATVHAATSKTTPVDADELPLVDSAASFILKRLTWANLKATLKTYFDTLYAATGSLALTYWTEAVNSSSPNATVPVVSFTPNNAATNVDAALIPKANGALLAVIPDGASTGGDKRGVHAVDWQIYRSAAAQVASGSRAVIGGGGENKASNSYAFVGGGNINTASGINSGVSCGYSNTASSNQAYVGGGRNNTANAQDAVIAGGYNNGVTGQWGACGGGRDNSVAGLYSFGIGYASKTLNDYSANFASGQFAAVGDAQEIRMVLRCNTTNATQTALTADQAAQATGNQLTLENNSAMTVKGLVTARENATGDAAFWEFTAAIKRGANAAATAMEVTCTPTQVGASAGAAAWALSVTADTTRGALQVKFTGEAAKTIRTVCALTAAYAQG